MRFEKKYLFAVLFVSFISANRGFAELHNLVPATSATPVATTPELVEAGGGAADDEEVVGKFQNPEKFYSRMKEQFDKVLQGYKDLVPKINQIGSVPFPKAQSEPLRNPIVNIAVRTELWQLGGKVKAQMAALKNGVKDERLMSQILLELNYAKLLLMVGQSYQEKKDSTLDDYDLERAVIKDVSSKLEPEVKKDLLALYNPTIVAHLAPPEEPKKVTWAKNIIAGNTTLLGEVNAPAVAPKLLLAGQRENLVRFVNNLATVIKNRDAAVYEKFKKDFLNSNFDAVKDIQNLESWIE